MLWCAVIEIFLIFLPITEEIKEKSDTIVIYVVTILIILSDFFLDKQKNQEYFCYCTLKHIFFQKLPFVVEFSNGGRGSHGSIPGMGKGTVGGTGGQYILEYVLAVVRYVLPDVVEQLLMDSLALLGLSGTVVASKASFKYLCIIVFLYWMDSCSLDVSSVLSSVNSSVFNFVDLDGCCFLLDSSSSEFQIESSEEMDNNSALPWTNPL